MVYSSNREIINALSYLQKKIPSRNKKYYKNINCLAKIFKIENTLNKTYKEIFTRKTNKEEVLSSLYTVWNELRIVDLENEILGLNALDDIKIELGISDEEFDRYIKMIEEPDDYYDIYGDEVIDNWQTAQ